MLNHSRGTRVGRATIPPWDTPLQPRSEGWPPFVRTAINGQPVVRVVVTRTGRNAHAA